MKLSDLLFLGAAGYGAYWLYQQLSGPASSASNAANTATSAIANLFSGTSPAATLSSNTVQFPDGSSIPTSAITGQTWVGNVLTFPYNGSTWQLSAQVNGVYQATQLSGLGSYASVRRNYQASLGLIDNDDPMIKSLGDVDNDPYLLRGVMR